MSFFLLWIKQLIHFLNNQLIVWFKRLHKIFICVSQSLKVNLYQTQQNTNTRELMIRFVVSHLIN